MNGSPIPGCDEEADALWKAQQMPPPMPGMPGQPGIEGLPPGASEVPQIASNAPSAQGAMGQLGGRPQLEGTPLSTMVAASLRTSRPALSALLAASRNKRGGLSALLQNNASMHSIGSMLNYDRSDLNSPSMSVLLKKGIRDYIEEDVLDNPEDKFMFKGYEDLLEGMDALEVDLAEQAREFYVRKGMELADIVKKEFAEIVIKGESGVDDITGEELREEYKRESESFANKAVELGYASAFALVQKANGDMRDPDPFEAASMAAAGRFLDRSADLRVKATKKALQSIIKEGLEIGADSSEIADTVSQRFSWIGTKRSHAIARTELAAAVWAGQDAAYEKINQDAGRLIIKEVVLWPSLDTRDCKVCDAHNGHMIKNYETGEEGLELPVHVNCRCAGRPILTSR
jgi:hypothetical protein